MVSLPVPSMLSDPYHIESVARKINKYIEEHTPVWNFFFLLKIFKHLADRDLPFMDYYFYQPRNSQETLYGDDITYDMFLHLIISSHLTFIVIRVESIEY